MTRPDRPSEAKTRDGRTSIGFMPLLDCAPIIIARELGFAADEGLSLDLHRETSWANIRDRVYLGHFDAAHMLAPMALATRLGIGRVPSPVVAPWVIDHGGNSIAITPALHAEGGDWGAPGDPVASGRALARVVAARAARRAEPPTLAAVYPFSCHHYQLCHWLEAAGLSPERDVRLVVVPPPHMVEAMASGSVDVVCVGAPWTSRAAEAGVGRLLMPASAIWPSVPEKVLALRDDVARDRPDETAALLRALDRAAAWCDDPANRRDLAAILAQPDVVGVAPDVVERALAGRLPVAEGGAMMEVPGFLRFHGSGPNGPINRPRHADGLWFAAQMLRRGQFTDRAAAFEAARATFSPALWDEAFGHPASDDGDTVTTFAGPIFSGASPDAWLAATFGAPEHGAEHQR